MRMVEKRVMLAGVALLGLAMVLPAGEAFAGKKEKLKAKVNGKGFKANMADTIVGTYDPNTHLLIVAGNFAKIKIGHGQTKFLSLSCVVDLQALPATGACVSQYSSTVISGLNPTSTSFAGEGITVNVKSLNGTRVTGTFDGTIEGDDAPATVKGGKFAVDLPSGV